VLTDATTHDSELARHLHISHQHLGVDEFEASLVDPRTGLWCCEPATTSSGSCSMRAVNSISV